MDANNVTEDGTRRRSPKPPVIKGPAAGRRRRKANVDFLGHRRAGRSSSSFLHGRSAWRRARAQGAGDLQKLLMLDAADTPTTARQRTDAICFVLRLRLRLRRRSLMYCVRSTPAAGYLPDGAESCSRGRALQPQRDQRQRQRQAKSVESVEQARSAGMPRGRPSAVAKRQRPLSAMRPRRPTRDGPGRAGCECERRGALSLLALCHCAHTWPAPPMSLFGPWAALVLLGREPASRWPAGCWGAAGADECPGVRC